jgi:hypothetical protein
MFTLRGDFNAVCKMVGDELGKKGARSPGSEMWQLGPQILWINDGRVIATGNEEGPLYSTYPTPGIVTVFIGSYRL